MGGRITGGADAVDCEDVGKEDKSHELEEANASLPPDEDKSWANVGAESMEFSEPDKIPAEPAVGLSCCCWLLAAAMPSKVDMKALPAATWSGPATEAAGLGVVGETLDLSLLAHLLELLLFTTHFLMCFSSVEATLKGMAQNRHLYMSLPIRPWVFMCLVSFELCAQA